MENLLLPLIILIPLLLITFRGRKQQKAFADLQQRLAAGQDVMTTAGLHGHLVSVDGDVVVLRIADGVQVRWARSAIATIISDPAATATSPPVDVTKPELSEPRDAAVERRDA